MSTIPRPKSGVTPIRTILSTESGRQFVLTNHTSPDSTMLYIGSAELYCVSAQIFPQTPSGRTVWGGDIRIGNLPNLYYNVRCALYSNFIRGSDTNTILRLLLSYISVNYPYVTALRFEDASYRDCDEKGQVKLPEMSYLLTGKTWYEKHYNAYLLPEDAVRFASADREFQELKLYIPWSAMKTKIGTTSDEYKELFESANTWQQFFVSVRDRIGISAFYRWLAPWLTEFMRNAFSFRFFGTEYRMPIRNTIVYTEQPYTRGGKRSRRHTRRKVRVLQPADLSY